MFSSISSHPFPGWMIWGSGVWLFLIPPGPPGGTWPSHSDHSSDCAARGWGWKWNATFRGGSYFWLLLRATKWLSCHLLLCLIWKKMMYVSKYTFSVSRILLPYHCCIYPSNLFHTHHLLQPTSPPGTLLIHQGRSSGSLHRAITQTSKHLFFGATGFRMDTRNLDTTSSIFTDGYDPPVLTSCQTINHFWGERSGFSLNTSENFQHGWISESSWLQQVPNIFIIDLQVAAGHLKGSPRAVHSSTLFGKHQNPHSNWNQQ